MLYERIEWPVAPRKKERTLSLDLATAPTSLKFDLHTGQPQYHGYMTPGAVKRAKRAIMLLLAIAEPKKAMNFKLNRQFTFKVNFITLTLPTPQGDITDKQIKSQVLDVWLKAAKRRFGLRSYMWRAERQKNGNLHFHIITDTYIPYDQLRDTWNQRLNRLQFIDKFEKKHGHRHPNSTDVHSINNVKNLAAYFIKYFSKTETTAETCRPVCPWTKAAFPPKPRKRGPRFQYIPTLAETRIDGKVWDCSRNLKHKGNCELFFETDALDMWNRAAADPEVSTRELDFCSIVFLDPAQFDKYVIGDARKQYNEWLNTIRNIPDEVPRQVKEIPIEVPF